MIAVRIWSAVGSEAPCSDTKCCTTLPRSTACWSASAQARATLALSPAYRPARPPSGLTWADYALVARTESAE